MYSHTYIHTMHHCREQYAACNIGIVSALVDVASRPTSRDGDSRFCCTLPVTKRAPARHAAFSLFSIKISNFNNADAFAFVVNVISDKHTACQTS